MLLKEVLVTRLENKMFNQARLKLTSWYLLVIMFISLCFSALLYRVITLEVLRATQFQKQRIERQFQARNFPPPLVFYDQEIIDEVKKRVLLSLGLVNGVILITAGGLGYILAGKTLKPIKVMLDEQNRFISDSSHELRTPLTSLKTSTEVALLDKTMTIKEARALIKENLKDINRIQTLSDELLVLAQFQKPNTKNKFIKVSLKKILEKSIRDISSQAKHKNIKINLSPKQYFLNGLEDDLNKLFVIILDNAIKYSPEKSTISIKTSKTGNCVAIKIKDQGVGIDQKDIPHIFDRFYRADQSRTNSQINGYGLGLSIAKKIVELHKGQISVSSEVAKGSEFIIKLPK